MIRLRPSDGDVLYFLSVCVSGRLLKIGDRGIEECIFPTIGKEIDYETMDNFIEYIGRLI
jgi:hypothetical protein